MRLVQKNEATASRRRLYFFCVDATDFSTPETGEAGGQPQITTDGGSWTNTGIGTLVAVGNGLYYAELTQSAVNVSEHTVIDARYKSANTSETLAREAAQIVPAWQAVSGSVVPANVTQIDGQATSGNNATLNLKQLSVVNSEGSAIVATSSGGSGAGILATGHNTGSGLQTVGGSGGSSGIRAAGGGAGAGLTAIGGTTGPGVAAVGGATSGHGILSYAQSGNSVGVSAAGTGSGPGVQSVGGTTGHGIYAVGGGSGGSGLRAVAQTNASGLSLAGQGTGHGISATAGATGDGILAATTAGAAIRGTLAGSVTGDVQGKILGGGASSITGAGARVVDASGNNVAPAATALTNATWTDARATKLDNLDATVGSRLAASGYTAPDNTTIGQIADKTEHLPANPAATSDIPSAAAVATQVRTELTPELAHLDADVGDCATPANITAAVAALRGGDGDTLETLSDQLDVIGAGAGLRQVTVHVHDVDTLASLVGVSVAVYDSGNASQLRRGVTDSSGNVVFSLDDGSYRVRLAFNGYQFTVPLTLTVTADATVTYTGDAWVLPTPSAPDKCMIYDWVLDASGAPIVGASITVRAVVPGAAGGHQLGDALVTTATGVGGAVAFELVRGARISIMAPGLGYEDAKKTVPMAAQQQLSTW